MSLVPTEQLDAATLAKDYNGGINKDNVARDAGIEYAKLDLTSSIVLADLATAIRPQVDATVLGGDVSPNVGTPHDWVDVTGLSAEVTTVGTRDVVVHFSGKWAKNDTNAGLFRLRRDTTTISAEIRDTVIGANAQAFVALDGSDLALAAGTYTYKVQTRVEADNAVMTVYTGARIIITSLPA